MVTKIVKNDGREGPRHDPYSCIEVEITRGDGRYAKVHYGLAEFLIFRTPEMDTEMQINGDNPPLSQIMTDVVGMNGWEALDALERLERHRLKLHRGHGGFREVSGFPGETLTMCKCGEQVDYQFDRSAVE